ncbi:response regulator transcription factor [Planctobacterium marinum]|uniref:DNA-binding response regulator n=1 Tax=Planctobacterium marinum TaxID=1631968 RepID=A0AA48I9A6_9ALTE|nr:DNA-binding response regulator [Planctobacterium marinum]
MTATPPEIIYVEDDASSAEILTLYLEKNNLKVSHFDNASDARRAIENMHFDSAILDIMLPGGDGRDLLKLAVQKKLPAIMVTAKITESDRINGFELGADDYVCKPYSPRELVARVLALLNRTQRGHQLKALQFEGLSLDLSSQLVTCDNSEVRLTAAEFSLLRKLAEHPGRIFSRQLLLDAISGDHSAVTERTIDTHFTNIRKKLNDNKQQPRFIATRYGQGYLFVGTPIKS